MSLCRHLCYATSSGKRRKKKTKKNESKKFPDPFSCRCSPTNQLQKAYIPFYFSCCCFFGTSFLFLFRLFGVAAWLPAGNWWLTIQSHLNHWIEPLWNVTSHLHTLSSIWQTLPLLILTGWNCVSSASVQQSK